VAERQFAETREQVRVALGALERSGELTRDGTHFVAGMRARLEELLAEPVSETSRQRAMSIVNERQRQWEAMPRG
jgi:hypothetical protein